MRHITFGSTATSYDVAILIKGSSFDPQMLEQYYVDPLVAQGIPKDKIIAFDLNFINNKASATLCKQYLSKLLPALTQLGVKYLYCADASYFKVLTKQTKADPHFGYVLDCGIPTFEHFQVTIGLNYTGLVYNPNQYTKLDLSLTTLSNIYAGNYKALGENIIQHEDYPKSFTQIEWFLNSLHQHTALTCDIETFSLKVHEAGIGTIAFAWNEHEGGAFTCDLRKSTDPNLKGEYIPNPEKRKLLRQFFEKYRGNIKYHNGAYDIKILIWNLFMQHPLDYQGMLYGLEVMTRNIDDTKIIAYLALNSTAEQSYSLKDLGHEYAGNYAQSDINDIRKIPRENLLRYNLVDCLTTWYVYKKYYAPMVADKQLELYEGLMKDSLKIIIQMELVGMPVLASKVQEIKQKMLDIQNEHLTALMNSQVIQITEAKLQLEELAKINAKLKTIQHGIDKVQDYKFNPASNNHLRYMLYTVMKLPVVDLTKTKEPATGAKTLAKLVNHTQNQHYIDVLKHLIELSKVGKILAAFIPALENAVPKANGRSYLHGSFLLGGTLSGRLSSSNPNMQNLPSGSKYGKLIKSTFVPPKGWIMLGADFNALEDRINTLLTRDPNKLKIFLDGYDGHSFRTYNYWPDQLPGIVNTVESINSIQDLYEALRGKSKAPSFALQYGGTYATLMKNCGFSEAEARKLETNYHKMYEVSDKWTAEKIKSCCENGYIDVAFGLRIRTPILAKSVLGNSRTLREAESEARSVGNAISGQSYGLLNNRAASAFMKKVWASEYKYDIFLVSLIHDAIYIVCKDDVRVVEWVNRNLIEEMAWQDLPEIKHDKLKLEAELDVHYPSWAEKVTLPNHASVEEILQKCRTLIE